MLLEEELGAILFRRGKTKITLTEEGMLLRRRAQEIVDLTDKAEKEFADWNKDSVAGEICIGSAETITFQLLARIMIDFKKEYPLVTYNINTGNADDITERISKGLVDIGLLVEPVDLQKFHFTRSPEKAKWGVMLQGNSRLAKKGLITPTDLIDEPIIQTKRAMVQNEIANWFGDAYQHLNIVATYNLVNNAIMMVQAGLGSAISLGPEAWDFEAQGISFRPFHPVLETGSVFIWKKNQVLSPAATKFIRYIRDALDE